MRLRMKPSVIKIHASHKKCGYEQQFAELQLYTPWKDENDLFIDDEEKCIELYERKLPESNLVKAKVFPFSSRDYINDLIETEGRHDLPDDIGIDLDATGTQDNLLSLIHI